MSYPTVIRPDQFKNKETPAPTIIEDQDQTIVLNLSGCIVSTENGILYRISEHLYVLKIPFLSFTATATDPLYIGLPTSIFKKGTNNLLRAAINYVCELEVNTVRTEAIEYTDAVSTSPRIILNKSTGSITLGEDIEVFSQIIIIPVEDY